MTYDDADFQIAIHAAQISPELCREKSTHARAIELALSLIKSAKLQRTKYSNAASYEEVLKKHSIEGKNTISFYDGVVLLMEDSPQKTRQIERFKQIVEHMIVSAGEDPMFEETFGKNQSPEEIYVRAQWTITKDESQTFKVKGLSAVEPLFKGWHGKRIPK